MAFPRILLSLSDPKTTRAPYTAGEKTPNLALGPMNMPGRAWSTRAEGVAMDAAWTDARWETTNDDPPVAAPFNVKALQEATRQKKARMLRRKFMIALIVYWYNSEMNVYNFLLLFAKLSSSSLRSVGLIHSHTRRQRACCCSVVVLCWSVVVGCWLLMPSSSSQRSTSTKREEKHAICLGNKCDSGRNHVSRLWYLIKARVTRHHYFSSSSCRQQLGHGATLSFDTSLLFPREQVAPHHIEERTARATQKENYLGGNPFGNTPVDKITAARFIRSFSRHPG